MGTREVRSSAMHNLRHYGLFNSFLIEYVRPPPPLVDGGGHHISGMLPAVEARAT